MMRAGAPSRDAVFASHANRAVTGAVQLEPGAVTWPPAIRRTFDIMLERARRHGGAPCLAGRVGPPERRTWRVRSVADCMHEIDASSRAMIVEGILPGDRVALVGANSPEWMFADFAAQQIGAATVPLFPSIGDPDMIFMLGRTKARLCLVTDGRMQDRIDGLRHALPELHGVYSLTGVEGPCSWSTRIAAAPSAGDVIETRRSRINETDEATIIFTSGTTGTPKGVVLSHRNIVSNVRAITQAIPLPAGGRALSGLPLSHGFERLVSLSYIASGVSVYLLDDLSDLGSELRTVRPDYLAVVPRLIEKQYEALLQRGEKLPRPLRGFFDRALDRGRSVSDPRSAAGQFQRWLAKRTIFTIWRRALGGKVRLLICGGARLEQQLGRLLAAAGITLIEGYGLTEASTFVAVNRRRPDERREGTMGLPVPGVTVCIAEDGEILVRGPNIMTGYLDRPDLTAEVIDADGWLHTGDLGELDADGFLTITGRKKDLFKLSVGKYIAPEALESLYRQSPYIDQVLICGEGRKYVAALIVPDFDHVAAWCRANDFAPVSNADLVADPRVRSLIEGELERLGRTTGHVERVKRFQLLADAWTIQNEELTPALKLRRHIIASRYARQIERCYAAA